MSNRTSLPPHACECNPPGQPRPLSVQDQYACDRKCDTAAQQTPPLTGNATKQHRYTALSHLHSGCIYELPFWHCHATHPHQPPLYSDQATHFSCSDFTRWAGGGFPYTLASPLPPFPPFSPFFPVPNIGWFCCTRGSYEASQRSSWVWFGQECWVFSIFYSSTLETKG